MTAPATKPDPLSLIRSSPLFDEGWYCREYPDLMQRELDPARHYLRAGAKGLCDPGPEFSSQFYLDTHPQAARRGVNPLVHQINHPEHEGLDAGAVLQAAEALRQKGQPKLAMTLARRHLKGTLARGEPLLCANVAAAAGDPEAWCQSLNRYLALFDQEPLRLDGAGGPVLDRLAPATPPTPRPTGPKISVLMAVHQAESTVATAVRSVLEQTWQNLELIVVDDASTDQSLARIRQAAEADPRMRVLHNTRNVGPYVCKNIALQVATGTWITGLDADEWALPTRLERQMDNALRHDLKASSTGMLRLTPHGLFSQIRRVGKVTPDGVLQHSPISTLFQRDFLKKTLGSWDSARFGADAELMARATLALGKEPPSLPEPGLLSLDLEGSLTNNPEFGLHPRYGMTPGRRAYREAWKYWHKEKLANGQASAERLYCTFPPESRRYRLPHLADVPLEDIQAVISTHGLGVT